MRIVGLHIIIFFVGISIDSYSQLYSLSPSNIHTQNLVYDDITYEGIYIKNITSDSLNLSWSKLSVDTVPGCFFGMCISGFCLNNLYPGGDIKTIAPGDTGWIILHSFIGNKQSGTNTVKLLLYPTGDSTNADTLTYIINVSAPNGIKQSTDDSVFCLIFPTITDNMVTVRTNEDLVKNMIIYNTLGEVVLQKTNINSSDFFVSLESMNNGWYKIIIETNKGTVTSRKVCKIN